MLEFSLASAFILGAMGSAHCLGMCGGIIGALSVANDPKSFKWLKLLLYQFGRILSYSVFGVIAGFLGNSIGKLSPIPILPALSGILLILMGLYLSRWWLGLVYIEKAGAIVWKAISPLSKKLLPVESPWQALTLGMLWGWLPCGLVYTALGYAIATANPVDSGFYMLFFGLGTLPATLSIGAASSQLKSIFNNRYLRIFSSLIMIGVGVYMLQDLFLTSAVSGGHHHHHH